MRLRGGVRCLVRPADRGARPAAGGAARAVPVARWAGGSPRLHSRHRARLSPAAAPAGAVVQRQEPLQRDMSAFLRFQAE